MPRQKLPRNNCLYCGLPLERPEKVWAERNPISGKIPLTLTTLTATAATIGLRICGCCVEFGTVMGGHLKALGDDIHAVPRIHGSVFAINRDTRFSPDKTPYKTHLDLWFWQGPGPGRACRGRTYQRVPQGLPKDHPRADFLCHSGLFAEVTLTPAPLSDNLPELCKSHYQRFAPLQRWLVDLLSAG